VPLLLLLLLLLPLAAPLLRASGDVLAAAAECGLPYVLASRSA
jgi:hypothetical protein